MKRERKTGLLTKVLLTNGSRFVEVFWLSHDGTDIYCGPSFINSHRSYHGSGEVHSKLSGYLCNENHHVPLGDFVGEFFLEGLGIANVPEWFEERDGSGTLRGGKADISLVIDLRTVPPEVTVNIRFGLLEPWRADLLLPKIKPVELRQILFVTSTRPWMYAAVFWMRAA